MDKNDKSEDVENIKQQIDEVLKEIERLKNETTQVRNAAELTRFEKQIAKTTDRLAGLLTAKAVQEALDSDELSQQSSELIKGMPGKMENQGQRKVKVSPLRGEAFTVKTSYYTKKKKSKKKKKNGKKAALPWTFCSGNIRSFYIRRGRASVFDCHDRRLVSRSQSGTARSRRTY